MTPEKLQELDGLEQQYLAEVEVAMKNESITRMSRWIQKNESDKFDEKEYLNKFDKNCDVLVSKISEAIGMI
ncbi:MAG: hypothetical protein HQK59_14290 [Deltaproteobacteria bacterium]|nr:hypothetical protein [Deltaproteobacteria bacterium]